MATIIIIELLEPVLHIVKKLIVLHNYIHYTFAWIFLYTGWRKILKLFIFFLLNCASCYPEIDNFVVNNCVNALKNRRSSGFRLVFIFISATVPVGISSSWGNSLHLMLRNVIHANLFLIVARFCSCSRRNFLFPWEFTQMEFRIVWMFVWVFLEVDVVSF